MNDQISFRYIKPLDGKDRLQIENPKAKKRFAVVELRGDRDLASDLTLAIRGMDISGIEKRRGFVFEYCGCTYRVKDFTSGTLTLVDITPDVTEEDDDE